MDFLPIGLGTLKAMLASRGFPCRLVNLSGLGRRELDASLRQHRPAVVGVSMFTFNRARSATLLAWAREACPGAILLAGGPHPTHLPAEVLDLVPALDAVVVGEGEGPLLAILERLREAPDTGAWKAVPGLVFRGGPTSPAEPLQDLDAIGIPGEWLAPEEVGTEASSLGYLSTSRGCPAACAFCSTPAFWGRRLRFRSAASVLAEMRQLQERFGLTYFSFRDDAFTTRKGRVLDLAARIQGSGLHPLWNCQSRVNLVDEERLVALKRAGCEFIQFGVEHASPRMLAVLDKGADPVEARRALELVRKVGLNLGIYLITGIPGETEADLQASVNFVGAVRPHDVQISPLAVYPGTRIFAQGAAEGRYPADFFRTSADLEILARPDAFTERAVKVLRRAAEAARPRARYSPAEFAQQKRFLGWCATTNLLCGEAAEEAGRPGEAESEYSEVIRREPGNTWGFLKRALLRHRAGRCAEALADLREVLHRVPRNPEARDLAEAWGLEGRTSTARRRRR